MSDIFREVDEDVRKDQLTALWKKYGVLVIAAAVALVVGTGASVAWREYQASVRDKEAQAYLSAVASLQESGTGPGLGELGRLAAEGDTGYATLARLQEAAALQRSGDLQAAVASYEVGRGYNSITRLDGQRTVTVNSNADLSRVEPMAIVGEITRDYLPSLLSRHPGVSYELSGSSREERSSLFKMAYAFMAGMFGIYALMAIPLKSYLQPLIIMSVIPFGIIGAVVGHMALGLAVSTLSLIGIIALAGVVVNDSLIMVDFVNKAVATGADAARAAVEAGKARFRAILLTSLTTFFGLIPIATETSESAQIVVPMAVSLAFGILFSTVITLILVPCLYNILADVNGLFSRRAAEPPVLEKR